MSFLTRSYLAPESSFTPLFRLLEDYDNYNYSRDVNQQGQGERRPNRQGAALPAFSPKFDVKELEHSYELHGELPGIEKKDINIEFNDDSTITISGRVERHYTSGNPQDGGAKDHGHSHKATVEDEAAEASKKQTSSTEVAKNNKQHEVQKSTERLWVSERSIGTFHRTFTFPGHIDQEGVTASLTNGILTITVPKAKKTEGRRITIQ